MTRLGVALLRGSRQETSAFWAEIMQSLANYIEPHRIANLQVGHARNQAQQRLLTRLDMQYRLDA